MFNGQYLIIAAIQKVMIYKLKKYLKLVFFFFMFISCVNRVKSVDVVERCMGTYRFFTYPDSSFSTAEDMVRENIRTVFTVKFKNSKGKVVYISQALLKFVPDISSNSQMGKIIEIVCRDFRNIRFFVWETVSYLAETSYYPAEINVSAVPLNGRAAT